MPDSAGYIDARAWSAPNGLPFGVSFLALGDGTHKLAVPADVRARIGEQAGDRVTVHLHERLSPTPRGSTR